jgi:hypothetical protein
MSALVLAAGPAAPAAAQAAADRDDVRCLLVLSLVGQDAKNQAKAAQGSFYFLGQLEARGQGAKLGPLLIAESKNIQNAGQAQAELTRCTTELNGAGRQLGAGFQQLKAASPAPKAAPAKK